MKTKFYRCPVCKKIVLVMDDSPVPLMCCGNKMEELNPNTVEASVEKHLPVVKAEENTLTVSVGSAAHPMEDAHFIKWIYAETDRGGSRVFFAPGQKPEAKIPLTGKPLAVYAYCNLHGLWKTEL